jgi:tetraacyldisaccharide 4'-kinase
MNVALVGHAYGASPARAREVCLEDDVEAVGDEALLCARRLASVGVPVFVGRSRQAALDRALASADVVVVDGLCQATPRRATLALLAVDSWAPWGAGYCPPRGDLRASVEKLLFAADRLVAIGDGQEPLSEGQLPVDRVEVLSKGAWFTSQGRRALLDWHTLRSLRVGLWTGVARPDRIVRQLAAQGVYPRETVFDLDHAIVTRNELKASRTRLDLWLMTEKCEANLGARRRRLGVCADVPIATLDHSFRLGSGLLGKLSHLDPSHTRP